MLSTRLRGPSHDTSSGALICLRWDRIGLMAGCAVGPRQKNFRFPAAEEIGSLLSGLTGWSVSHSEKESHSQKRQGTFFTSRKTYVLFSGCFCQLHSPGQASSSKPPGGGVLQTSWVQTSPTRGGGGQDHDKDLQGPTPGLNPHQPSRHLRRRKRWPPPPTPVFKI